MSHPRTYGSGGAAAMAGLLGVSRAEVLKMKRRSEPYIGTLRKFIEAMNGELVLAARFDDGVLYSRRHVARIR